MSFSFNTPTTNTGTPIASFSFGTPKPAMALATVAPTFGTPAAATATAFGAPAATTVSAFGSTATAMTPAFGAPSTGSAFGAPAAAVAPSFGAPAAATVPAFGAQTASTVTATPTLPFGSGLGSLAAPAPTNPSTFSFGATTAASTAASSTTATPSLTFGTGGGIGGGLGGVVTTLAAAAPPTTAPPAFGFGATTATTSAALPTLGLAGGSFSFAKPATTVATLNFGTTTTTATAAPFNTGIGGGAAIGIGSSAGGIFSKSLTGSIGGGASLIGPTQATTTAPSAFIGLGGVDVTTTQPKPGDAKLDTIKIKETQVPDEIAKTVEALKHYIKEQKTIASDIGRTSTTKFTNVSGEITKLQWSLQEISNSVETNYQQIKLLRVETSKAIQSVEMAQRTQDTPSGLQIENYAPFQFFQSLVVRYEQDLIDIRQEIVLTERHMHALANPQNILPDELKRGFEQVSEAFISIAGRVHEIHQKVEEQKEEFLNLRRYRLRDATNVFENLNNTLVAQIRADPMRISSGPTPFSNLSLINTLSKSYNVSCTGAANNVNGSQTCAK